MSQRSILAVTVAALVVGSIAAAPQRKAPAAAGQKKIENTAPALRLKAFEQHQTMRASSPFKDVKWRFIGPLDVDGS